MGRAGVRAGVRARVRLGLRVRVRAWAAPAGSVHRSPRSRRCRGPARATPGVRGGARVRVKG